MISVLLTSFVLGVSANADEGKAAVMETSVESALSNRTPSGDFDEELKKLKQASVNKDESGVIQAATHILGEDAKNLAALNALAVYYYNQSKFGLAKILIRRAMADHPNQPALYNNLGVIALGENDQRQAMGYFRRALEIQPKYAYASSNLGAICLEYKDYAKAASVLESAYSAVKSDLRRGSYAMDVAGNYAQALSGSGDSDKAKSLFKKLIDIDDQNPSLLYNYAVLLVTRLKDKDESEKVIARLKFLADDATLKKVQELEKQLSGT